MIGEIAPFLGEEMAASFAAEAASVTQELQSRCQQVSSYSDIFKGPQWRKQANVLARADAEIARQTVIVEPDTRLTDDQISSRVTAISLPHAEQKVRQMFEAAGESLAR